MCSPGTIASPRVLGCLKWPRGLHSISAGGQNKRGRRGGERRKPEQKGEKRRREGEQNTQIHKTQKLKACHGTWLCVFFHYTNHKFRNLGKIKHKWLSAGCLSAMHHLSSLRSVSKCQASEILSNYNTRYVKNYLTLHLTPRRPSSATPKSPSPWRPTNDHRHCANRNVPAVHRRAD